MLGASALLAALPASAQVMRRFPRTALRGEITFGAYPELLLNGQPARLAPGGRVRDMNHSQAIPNLLLGKKFIVNFQLNTSGFLQEVWILRPEEIANPWPRTTAEAESLRFDEVNQIWARP